MLLQVISLWVFVACYQIGNPNGPNATVADEVTAFMKTQTDVLNAAKKNIEGDMTSDDSDDDEPPPPPKPRYTTKPRGLSSAKGKLQTRKKLQPPPVAPRPSKLAVARSSLEREKEAEANAKVRTVAPDRLRCAAHTMFFVRQRQLLERQQQLKVLREVCFGCRDRHNHCRI